ncbi:MAG: SpoIIE family protein phosphatase, partial [Ilumatobacteraceae bacterium]
LMRRTAMAAVPRLGDWCTVHFAPQPGVHEIEVAHSDPDRMEWARSMRDRYPIDPNAAFGVPAVLRSGRTEFFAGVDRYLEDPSVAELHAPVPEDLQIIVEALGMTSIITVPLLTKRGVIGAMQFVSAESRRRYDDDDVALAEAAAGRIGAALDNAWHSEQQREIAATLQAALLPTHLPEIPGIGVAVRYWAAGAVSEVGGDFYDVFAIDEHRWAVVIGDVCGTGAGAAAITSTARHTIRAAATHGASPAEVLEWVNAAVLRDGDGRFCTVVYTELTAIGNGSWRAATVVGGHPLPVIVDASCNVESLGAHGTLIGALDHIRLTPTEQVLGPGTTIVMHTDGVNDVPAPHGLDDAALASLITGSIAAHSSADEIANRVGDAVAAILPIPERDDDIAIVVLRIS